MISDKERREVAARLREIMRRYPNCFLDNMIAQSILDVMGEGAKIGETLADLIDRPTCSMEYRPEWSGDEIYPTEVYECSACGQLTYDGKPDHYCPGCGAEVVSSDAAR